MAVIGSRVAAKHIKRGAVPVLSWLRQRALMDRGFLVHPAVAVPGILVFGFTFIVLIAGILSPSLRFPVRAAAPIFAAVTSPIVDVVTGSDSSDNQDQSAPPADAPSGAADGIPANVITLYQAAARTCNMPWEILAGVGKVETNHGLSNAAGVHSGANFAGAEGPMQFMPATWAKYGIDANHDGKKNVYDQTDAVYSAANYLCANGARDNADMHNALFHYNHDESYVSAVMAEATQYKNNAYVLPVTDDVAASLNFGRPHHDYPADDIAMPVGTQVYAVRGGTVHTSTNASCGNEVQIDGTDGYKYTYCHASAVQVGNGDTVDTGDPILKSGGQPGMAGAGDSTGPHLHLQITVNGSNVCPQGLLSSWQSGQFESPSSAPTHGCVG